MCDLLVASPFTGQMRNFLFPPCEPGQAWQAEKPESPRSFAVAAKIFARDKEMWPRHTDGIDLLELNRGPQMRESRMTHLFFFEIRALLQTHSKSRIHPFLLENAASI